VFYIIAILIAVLCLVRVRDTWHIRLEIAIVLSFTVVFVLLYLIFVLVPVLTTILDYIVPAFHWIQACIFLDNVVSIVVPCVASFVLERRRRELMRTQPSNLAIEKSNIDMLDQAGQLQFTLRNATLMAAFKTYAARSFAVESLLAWEEIQRYRSKQNPTKRKAAGLHIIDKFIKDGSVFELNLTGQLKKVNWAFRLEEQQAAVQVFDDLLRHVEQDMLDNFSRFM
jgi:Regulator of G protein signaling domain